MTLFLYYLEGLYELINCKVWKYRYYSWICWCNKSINIPSSWCHGLSGHLSSRITLKKYGYNDEFIDKEIKSAVKNIIDRGLNHNFCLCHGDLGNLLELFESADILEDNVLREQVINVVHNYALKVEKENILESIFKFEENNGIMTGISGIGYVMLKILYPDVVTDVLSL